MTTRFQVTGHDWDRAPDVLRWVDASGKYAIRPEYAALRCPTCGKVDERAACSMGLESVPAFRCSRSVFCSADGLVIGHTQFKAVLEDLFPGRFSSFGMPANPDYFVLDVSESIAPILGDVGYRFLKPCKTCGRYEQLIWSGDAPRVSAAPLVCITLELRLAKSQAWLVEKQYADLLRSYTPALRGICLTPKEVAIDNDAP